MSRLFWILGFIVVLMFFRAMDAFLTHAVLDMNPVDIKELNPFVKTVSPLSVFFSPVPLAIAAIAVLLFSLMVLFPEKALGKKNTGLIWDILVNNLAEFPLIILTMLFIAISQNACLLFLGRPLMPKFIDNFMYSNPFLGLLLLSSFLWIILGPIYRKITLRVIASIHDANQKRKSK